MADLARESRVLSENKLHRVAHVNAGAVAVAILTGFQRAAVLGNASGDDVLLAELQA